jgi:tryptophan synthase alpha chain
MSQRLANALHKTTGTGLITYLMAGDPNADTTLRRLLSLAEAGVNILELGIPFSDPIADGPVIQTAGLRALQAGMNVTKVLRLVQTFRQQNQETPILLMSYLNPLISYNYSLFLQRAIECGVDGLILPDLPWRESKPFRETAQEVVGDELTFIPMIAQTSLPDHIQSLGKVQSGFVYVLSHNGITGGAVDIPSHLLKSIQDLKKSLTVPRYVGFGIQSPTQVAKLSEVCDGVIVGSALVNRFAQIDALNLSEEEKVLKEEEVYAWILSLRGRSV